MSSKSGAGMHTQVLACTLDDDMIASCCHAAMSPCADEDEEYACGAGEKRVSVGRQMWREEGWGSAEQEDDDEEGWGGEEVGGGEGGLGIGVLLYNGVVMHGQSAISHPVPHVPHALASHTGHPLNKTNQTPTHEEKDSWDKAKMEGWATRVGSSGCEGRGGGGGGGVCKLDGEGTSREGAVKMAHMRRSLSVDKNLGAASEPLPAPVQRVFYVRGGIAVDAPSLNARIPTLLHNASLVLLGPGSLFTSLIPSLILPGVGEAMLAARGGAQRILLLNAGADCEDARCNTLQCTLVFARDIMLPTAAHCKTLRWY